MIDVYKQNVEGMSISAIFFGIGTGAAGYVTLENLFEGRYGMALAAGSITALLGAFSALSHYCQCKNAEDIVNENEYYVKSIKSLLKSKSDKTQMDLEDICYKDNVIPIRGNIIRKKDKDPSDPAA